MAKVLKAGLPGIYPAPVVLVSCVSEESKPNIITLAWAGIVCSDPPTVAIAIRPGRYSHDLITLSGEFVVNMPTQDILAQTDKCGVVSGRDIDKFEAMNLTPSPATSIRTPLIEECPVSIECRVTQVISLGSHDLFLGQAVTTHIDESFLDERGRISDILMMKPVAYSPLTAEYLSMGDVVGTFGFSRSRDNNI